MDILLIVLIALVVLSLGGWGYGYYGRPAVGPGVEPMDPAGWVNPMGVIGLLLLVGLVVWLLTGYRLVP